jgi:SseB protein N-terminal domain
VESEVPRVVAAARAVMTGHCRLDEFKAVFAQATVFGVMPDHPGVWAAEIPGRGRWTLVFSTVERLAAYAGDCQFFSTTGADLLAQLPQGIGLILDPGDDHRMPMLSRMVPQRMTRGDDPSTAS